jgi:UDP-2,3-diacylglucosamine pyrophosphatase LpxH
MLVIISDLHLTDGSSGQTIRKGAFEAFRERLRDMAYDASCRLDNKYRPIERIDLVLLGDILDVIRSSKWCDSGARPWTPQHPNFATTVASINDLILERNQDSLAFLRSLHDPAYMSVPRATPDGQSLTTSRGGSSEQRQPVQIRIWYLVGNHDWFYHLRGDAFDEIRKSVVEAVGLENDPSLPFPHDPAESPAIVEAYREHAVFARHGDIFDRSNFDGDRDKSSLGDAIVIELVDRFPAEVKRRLGAVLPQDCITGLEEIDNVRPLIIIPAWIDGLLRKTCNPQQQQAVKQVWDELAREFLRLDFVRQHRNPIHIGLKLSIKSSIGLLSRMLLWGAARMNWGKDVPFYPNALNEPAFRDGSARFVVYGHTHRYEIVPLRSESTSAGLLEQIYINSGTWRPVHELAQFKPAEEQFVGYHVMTYIAFFRDGERNGRSFETWSGALESTA